ncbi:alpha/beta hydrolase [Saccharomonospora sp. NPDC046836]|uniref:alpha/beta hydrolase n=1 Tax=Saccharomonospora sp. NPDC046836 TaxID=3156921 RepID=UPI003402D338
MSVLTAVTTRDAWNEPDGIAPRGTLIVLTGRGETAASYARFGRRLAADAYRVRIVETAARARVEELLGDDSLPAPRVLVGSDSGAVLAAHLAHEHAGVDAVVLAGLPSPSAHRIDSWEAELDARTACPAHRRVLTDDAGFERGALGNGTDLSPVRPPAVPTLVLHGSADPLTASEDAFAPFHTSPTARVALVVGARHDVLNDVSHRSVAATIVLFLESLRLDSVLPPIVRTADAR